MKKIIALSIVLVALPALAQESPSFKLTEHVLNAGGHPAGGAIMTSGSFKISLDAIGEGILGGALTGPSYRMEGGFGSAYPPPGEVSGLRFTDHLTLFWDPEKSVGVYNLYRDLFSAVSGLGYGACEQLGLTGQTTIDTDTPPSTDGYFYLVTAENRLGEEGTKGWDSVGAERLNPGPCP